MGLRCCSCFTSEQKFYLVIALVSTFFIVEIVTGYICNSLALISDAFHMLSDLIAHIVGLCAVRISKMQSRINTFGWARAEVMGALVNAVFMLAVCLTIVLESIERFLHAAEVERPLLLLIVGVGGLLINVIAFFLFISGDGGHGHSHGGMEHGHSHGGGGGDTPSHSHSHSHDKGNKNDKKKHASASQMNISAVLRHVIGDALGSVIVIVVAVLIWKLHGAKWVLYLDPLLSLGLVIIMTLSTFPLLREASQVLMQQAPPQYEMAEFRQRLIKVVADLGVLSVHEFHVWRLAGSRVVASIHITCRDISTFMNAAVAIREFFHAEGIHSVTVQPEVVGNSVGSIDGKALLNNNNNHTHYRHGHSHIHHNNSSNNSELEVPCTAETCTSTPVPNNDSSSVVNNINTANDTRCRLTCSPDLKCQLVTCCPPDSKNRPTMAVPSSSSS